MKIKDSYFAFRGCFCVCFWSAFFTMDVMIEISFNRTWGYLLRDEDVDKWFEENEEILPMATMFSTLPWLAYIFSIPFIGRMVMPSDRDPTGSGKLIGVIKELVRKRSQILGREKKNDMIGSFFRHGITEQEAATEASLQIIAGTDTTATAMRTICSTSLPIRKFSDRSRQKLTPIQIPVRVSSQIAIPKVCRISKP